MKRPLRSVMLANPAYLSSYVLGVAQAMGHLGHWHREVSVLDHVDRVARQLEEMRPDVIWTHTVPWVPRESPVPGWVWLDLLAEWRRRGARTVLHDGDPRSTTRHPHSMAACFDIALCNHSMARPEWQIPTKRWPYAAMAQASMAEPVDALRCGLLFAGIARKDDELYSPRTDIICRLRERMGDQITVRTGGVNDRMQVADVAVSARAVFGFGRPEVPGWIDTRCVQYPGAGGVLVHDDAGGLLEPGAHFVSFERHTAVDKTVASIIEAFILAGEHGEQIRERAFAHVQANHTWRHRVVEALGLLGVA